MSDTPRTCHIETYYPALAHLRDRFERVHRQRGLQAKSAPEYRTWKTSLRAELASLLGLPTMQPCAGNPQAAGREQLAGYTREKVILQTEPGVWMPLYVLIPDGLALGERRPAVIAAHGHASAGKLAVVGRTDIPAVAEAVAQYNYAYGVTLVKAGFVVFCPDARGFGERRELPKQGDSETVFLHSSCYFLNHIALSLGQSLTGMWVWDLMRLLDYIATRPECDPARVACAGLSGGGLQTLWLAALDDRVRTAVVSGYFYGYKESLLELDHCACNYVPHLWEKVDMGDVAALIAPRPLLIDTGAADPLNGKSGLANVTSQIAIARQAYALLGAPDNLRHHIFQGAHRWSDDESIPWLKTHLAGSRSEDLCRSQ